MLHLQIEVMHNVAGRKFQVRVKARYSACMQQPFRSRMEPLSGYLFDQSFLILKTNTSRDVAGWTCLPARSICQSQQVHHIALPLTMRSIC